MGACYECGSGGGAVDRIQGWQSVNGGASFGAVPELGTTPTINGIGQDGIRLPGGGPFVTPAGGDTGFPGPTQLRIIARPGSSQAVQPGSNDLFGFLFVYSPTIVRVPGLNKLVYAVSNLAIVKTAIYNGPDLTAASIMTQGNWTTDRLLPSAEAENDETDLNAGPSGVWLTYLNKVTLDPHFAIRRFDTATDTFGAPRYLESAGAIDTDVGYPSSTQDASGRVHGVWRSLHDTGRLRYVRSDTAGATFTEPANIAAGETFIDPEVAAGPDGNGWAVWEGIGTTPIRVVRIEPYAEPAPAPAPPGAGTNGPAARAPVASPKPAPLKRFTAYFGTAARRHPGRGPIGKLLSLAQLTKVPTLSRVEIRCVRGCERRLRRTVRWRGGPVSMNLVLRRTTVIQIRVTAPSGATRAQRYRFRATRSGVFGRRISG